jgi:hypothetical protein
MHLEEFDAGKVTAGRHVWLTVSPRLISRALSCRLTGSKLRIYTNHLPSAWRRLARLSTRFLVGPLWPYLRHAVASFLTHATLGPYLPCRFLLPLASPWNKQILCLHRF